MVALWLPLWSPGSKSNSLAWYMPNEIPSLCYIETDGGVDSVDGFSWRTGIACCCSGPVVIFGADGVMHAGMLKH